MTSLAAGSPQRTADLPATLAGLWTAINATHDAALDMDDHVQPATAEARSRVACHLREAAETLASSQVAAASPGAADDQFGATASVLPEPDLAARCSDCITLAIEVLGNEDEPLTPFDVLAVTRAVSALCLARSVAQGVTA